MKMNVTEIRELEYTLKLSRDEVETLHTMLKTVGGHLVDRSDIQFAKTLCELLRTSQNII